MTLRDKYEQQCKNTVEYRDALTYLVLGRVDWTEQKMGMTIAGMPKKMLRFGLVDATAPFIIVHDVDNLVVWIVSPEDAAEYPWPIVDDHPKLVAFLRKHADINKITIHMPGMAWVRKENARVYQEGWAKK